MRLGQKTSNSKPWRMGTVHGFRKRCCSRFHSHLLRNQLARKGSRTCFEGPFGEVIRDTGPMAKANPFRFSTKYQDDETDLLYYGYRYYSASTGRWLSSDPIGEFGFQITHEDFVEKMVDRAADGMVLESPNGYLFVRNASTGAADLLGLVEVETGVNRAETSFAYIAIESHYFLEVDGNTCGFWPKGGKKKLLSLLPFMWVKGHVYSPDPLSPPEKLTPVKLDDCKYDIKKFKPCVQAQCYDHDTGRYNLLFHNCWHWRESLIDKCKKASKR
jgi:RHS repeat-associated protein